MFKLPEFQAPDFADEKYVSMPCVITEKVEKDGVAPEDFYLTTHMPTYYKVDDKFILPKHNSVNCVAVIKDDDVEIKEIRDLLVGDKVVLGDARDGSEGILLYKEGFPSYVYEQKGTNAI